MPRFCRLALEPPAARLTITKPPVNVLDLETIDEMRRALREVSASGCHVLTIASEGRDFSAGVDVRDHLPERLEDMLQDFHGLLGTLLELDAVTVALVQGRALGGGMELVACCDLAIASEDAVLAQPEIDLACFPPFGAALYPALVGTKRAAEIVLLARRLSAREALELGLVSRVVEGSRLEEEGAELVAALGRKSPAALRLAKQALRLGARRALEPLGAIETLYREELAATDDMLEGLTAFLEKREPRWRGT